MKLLFVTIAYPIGSESFLQRLNRGIPLAISSNTFQWAVIEGLYENQASFEVVSIPSLSSFPLNFRKLYSPQMDMIYEGERVGTMLKTLRLKFLSGVSGRIRLFNHVKDWVKRNIEDDKLFVLVYSPDSNLLNPLKRLKSHYRSLKVCTIVTDLPDDYNNPLYRLSRYRQFINKWKERKDKASYSVADGFVLLSKAMEEKIPSAIGHSVVIEGICRELPEFNEKKEVSIKVLFYSGSLGRHTSVDSMVDAFVLTKNPNFRLVICGSGEFADYVMARAQEDQRIEYKGWLPREDVLLLQKRATAVINPRVPSFSITKYSFPSKTMEYLSSGTPLIGYKLEGIPSEYYQYYYIVEDEKVETLAATISKVLSLPQHELNEMGKKAFLFMKDKKTPKKQVERLINFVNSV